jgi:hypothetical protein
LTWQNSTRYFNQSDHACYRQRGMVQSNHRAIVRFAANLQWPEQNQEFPITAELANYDLGKYLNPFLVVAMAIPTDNLQPAPALGVVRRHMGH